MVPQQLRFDDLTKEEIIALVNRQTRELASALTAKHNLMALLAAIVKHPDAFRYNEDGEAELDVAAIAELKENTRLKTELRENKTKMILKVRESTYVLYAEPMRLGVQFHDVH